METHEQNIRDALFEAAFVAGLEQRWAELEEHELEEMIQDVISGDDIQDVIYGWLI